MTMSVPTWQVAWAEATKNRDPLRFVTGVLDVEQPEPWQIRVLEAIRDGAKRISIRSGHGVGKTTLLAWLVLYGLLCFGPDTKIPIAAGSRDQLRDTIQPEIAKWWLKLPPLLQEQISVETERVYVRCDPDRAFAVFRTASKDNPQALAGFHAGNLMFLLDEASAISEAAYEVALGALSTDGAIVVMAGNPTRTNGFFYNSHHKLRDRWWTIRVSSEDVARARGHIDDVIASYGRDSNKYRVRVLGEFPTQDDEVVIPLDLVEQARSRDVATSNVWPVWGLDVARFGDDSTALVMRQGNTIVGIREWRQLDGAQVAGRIKAEYAATIDDMKPREIVVDIIGVGASVYDILRLDGSPVREIVRGCNVSESPAVSESDHRLRDELWFRGRAWFAERNCKFATFYDPAENALLERLIAELTAPTYDYTALGKRKVESKNEMKQRGLASPNLADAFLLSLAAGIYPKQDVIRRWSEAQHQTSWMAV